MGAEDWSYVLQQVPGALMFLGGTPLDDLPLEVVRRRIVVSEADPVLFAGTVFREGEWLAADRDGVIVLPAPPA